jgi:hypothetical protein
MSKALATIVTQPLIVAKVGLQSKPPPARKGKPFSSFIEVMRFIIEHEGVLGLFKGMGPQILKGLLVQGILMMTKEKYVYSVGEHPPNIVSECNANTFLIGLNCFTYYLFDISSHSPSQEHEELSRLHQLRVWQRMPH